MEGSVRSGRARYDDIADWYLPWVGSSPGLICDPEMGVMAGRLEGQQWLDVACGTGRTSRELARRGATVLGVDLSEELIRLARAGDAAELLTVSYRVADITQPAQWWDGEPFDGATCEMALMDIDDWATPRRATGPPRSTIQTGFASESAPITALWRPI